MRMLRIVLAVFCLLTICSCVTNPKYTATQESSDDYTIVYSDEVSK